ncbi:FixH family protein [Parasphingorhabdus sp.]|uniref:FixH family protein n=1 Tax=Parasphingorhabdus sp. TaxID=2709688 RepID=UPI0035932B15
MTEKKPVVKKFTGYHAAMIIVAFFAVVVSVNMVMARFALSTFGGTVVDNSYVASQKYNQWLEQARDQQAYGWTVSPAVRSGKGVILTLAEADGAALQGASVVAVAEHPVGRAEPFDVSFSEVRPGVYQSVEPLAAGRWKLKLVISRADKSMRVLQDFT